MTLSAWVTSARIIIFLEGLAGIASNILLIVVLVRANLGSTGQRYRVICIITALFNIYTSALIAFTINVPLFAGGTFLATLYGPILFFLPDIVVDFLYMSLVVQTHSLWQAIPVPAVLQYLSLKKPNMNPWRMILYSFAIPFVTYSNAWLNVSQILPSDELRGELEGIVYALHGAGPKDCKIYGIPAKTKNGEYGLVKLIFLDTAPSFIISYVTFIFCAYEIRKTIHSYGTTAISGRTQELQRRFFLSQVAQVVLPLILLSMPSLLIFVTFFTGKNLDNFSFLFVYSYWIFPCAQALLLLYFVSKSNKHMPRPWK